MRQEILNLWQKYPSLSPKEDYLGTYPKNANDLFFLDEEGTFGTKLILMEGTIPVNYKSILYHFPISIFVPSNYPTISPICYVSPTNGKIYFQSAHIRYGCKARTFESRQ